MMNANFLLIPSVLLALFLVGCKSSTPPQTYRSAPPYHRSEAEQDKINRLIASLEEDMEAIRGHIDHLRSEGDSSGSLPLGKLETRLTKEKELLRAFGFDAEEEDLLAMQDRLSILETRLERTLKRISEIKKLLQHLEDRVIKLQENVREVRKENPQSALGGLDTNLKAIEDSLMAQKNHLKHIDYTADATNIDHFLGEVEALEKALERARSSYRFTKGLDVQLEAGTLFEAGHYWLTPKGIRRMKTVAKDVARSVEKYRKRFPDEKLTLLIRVDGYADEQPFYAGQPEEERQRQNQLLSEKRAMALGKFVANEIRPLVDHLETAFQGYGEQLPPNTDAGDTNDPERRVCHLSVLVYGEHQ